MERGKLSQSTTPAPVPQVRCGLIRPPIVFGFPNLLFRSAYLPSSRNKSGLPSSCAFLSTHATLFVDPGRPSESSPIRFLCVGFWFVDTIPDETGEAFAICIWMAFTIDAITGLFQVFRKCGLPCVVLALFQGGLRRSLCTLQ